MRKIRLFFPLIFIFLFAACNNNRKQDISVKTFTFYSVDLNKHQPFTDITAQELTKKSGVFLDVIPSKGADDLSVMSANDSYPDLIYAKSDLARLIESGAVIPLDDYIEKYGDNMKKLYGDQLVKLKYSRDNPHIYSMGTFDIKNRVTEVCGTIQLQHSVLKELGYPKISTLEDLENALIAYKTMYPYINGYETIGFSLFCDDWYWYLGLSNPAGYLLGHPDDGQWFVDQNSFKVTYKFLDSEMPYFYRWLNSIYHKGLLDTESFTQKEDVFQAKLKNGNVLATSYTHWGLQDSRNYLIDKREEERTFAYLPVTKGPEYKDPALKDYGFSGGWGIAVSKSCKDPEGAFKFLDYMCSEEAQITLNWGVEGVTYEYDSFGKRIGISNPSFNGGIGIWVYPFPQAGKGAVDSKGQYIVQNTENQIRQSYCRTERETLRAYGVNLWTDLFPSSESLGVSPYGQVWQYSLSSESQDKMSRIDEFVKQSLIRMILGPENQFDSAWSQMTEGIKNMDIDSVASELNELIQQKMELWGN
ncbi:MAG: extracellular solute-binding protein [Treponema sp.]|nr:extracellular solute-binding protein [Treponema sp.]